jgi:ketosteroid isomerase-like protein
MASANLELVRSLYERWRRGDFSSVEWAHPEMEAVFADGPDPGTRIGVGAMMEGYRGWLSAWEDFRVEPEEYRELDAERVLVLTRWGGRGKTSGLALEEMQTKGAHLFHVRRERVTRFVVYFDRDHAAADLGLSSQAGPGSS